MLNFRFPHLRRRKEVEGTRGVTLVPLTPTIEALSSEEMEAIMPNPPSPKAPYYDRFDDILTEMSLLHNKKGHDYGGANDPYANVRASAEFGVDPWIGALVRMNDKITRLKSFIRQGNLVNESAVDSIQDIAVYAVIMRILYEEQYGRAPVVDIALTKWANAAIMQAGVEAIMREPGIPVTIHADPDPEHQNEQPLGELEDSVLEPEYNLCRCLARDPEAHEPHIVQLIDGHPVLMVWGPDMFPDGLKAIRGLSQEEADAFIANDDDDDDAANEA